MAIPATNYIFDQFNGLITTANQGTWADKSGATWDSWTAWADDPVTPMTWESDVLDLGQIAYFNLKWNIVCAGTPTFTVYVSQTGLFAGEETSTTVNVDDEDIEAFYGRYVVVFVSLAFDPTQGFPTITEFDQTASGESLQTLQYDVASNTLSGDASARTIVMPRTVSKVLALQLTSHTGNYVDESYVADSYVDEQAPGFPAIVSKTRTGPTVTFVSTSGTNVDAVFDLSMTVLPEQYMDGQNLTAR